MSEPIMVSVICNVYNHEKYLRDALDGFVMQKTSFPFEVLVHDDASTDSSAAIIREYEEKYPDIIKPIYQTVNQYSQKVPITREYQLPRVQGKYIALCEGDDYWTDPMKLQKQFDFLEQHPEYSLCSCSTVWQNVQTGTKEARGRVAEDRDISLEEIILEKGGRIFQYASNFIRTEVYSQFPAWRVAFPIGDYPLIVLAALNGKVRMLADVMTVYRFYSANSWTVRMDNDASRARISLKMIEGLEALNEATEYKHDEVIQRRILRHKYTYAIMTHDLKALRSGELKPLYKSRKWMYRASDVLRCKFPKLYTIAMKPIAKVIKSAYGYGE